MREGGSEGGREGGKKRGMGGEKEGCREEEGDERRGGGGRGEEGRVGLNERGER